MVSKGMVKSSAPRQFQGKSAFAYDFMLVHGGAESLALHALKTHPDLQLIAGFIDQRSFPELHALSPPALALTQASQIPGWQGLKVMRAFTRKGGFLERYEQVIFSGVYAPVGVQHRPGGENLYYCHTPPRFAYDLQDYYLDLASPWQRPLLKRLAVLVRKRYADAMARMDRIAVNSANVARRLHSHLGITGTRVIHPPVATDKFTNLGQGDYYLSTARLEPYKRVSAAVKAFKKMPQHKLVVASGGSELASLQQLAQGHDNIHFTGWCEPRDLRQLMGRCIATIYLARDEDFGMSPVESMAAGKPVIGVAEGGLLETVLNGETGDLLAPQDAENTDALCQAVEKMHAKHAASLREACEHQAANFGLEAFDRRFAEFRAAG